MEISEKNYKAKILKIYSRNTHFCHIIWPRARAASEPRQIPMSCFRVNYFLISSLPPLDSQLWHNLWISLQRASQEASHYFNTQEPNFYPL